MGLVFAPFSLFPFLCVDGMLSGNSVSIAHLNLLKCTECISTDTKIDSNPNSDQMKYSCEYVLCAFKINWTTMCANCRLQLSIHFVEKNQMIFSCSGCYNFLFLLLKISIFTYFVFAVKNSIKLIRFAVTVTESAFLSFH